MAKSWIPWKQGLEEWAGSRHEPLAMCMAQMVSGSGLRVLIRISDRHGRNQRPGRESTAHGAQSTRSNGSRGGTGLCLNARSPIIHRQRDRYGVDAPVSLAQSQIILAPGNHGPSRSGDRWSRYLGQDLAANSAATSKAASLTIGKSTRQEQEKNSARRHHWHSALHLSSHL
jgi:hypothetical protein